MSPQEALNRQRKAFALAAHLHRHGITAEEAGRWTVDQWNDVARVAGLRKPGRDGQTIEEAIEALRAMERPKLSAEEIAATFRRCKA